MIGGSVRSRRSPAAAGRPAPPGSDGRTHAKDRSVAALVVAGRAFLLRVRGDPGSHRQCRSSTAPARATPRTAPAPARAQHAARFPAAPASTRPGRQPETRISQTPASPEQRLLIALGAEIRDALAAVGEFTAKSRITQPGSCPRRRCSSARQPQRQRARRPQLVRDLRQQRTAHVRHQPRSRPT